MQRHAPVTLVTAVQTTTPSTRASMSASGAAVPDREGLACPTAWPLTGVSSTTVGEEAATVNVFVAEAAETLPPRSVAVAMTV